MKSKYESLLEAATPLPYEAHRQISGHATIRNDRLIPVVPISARLSEKDAQLIAHSANTLPKALEALIKLRDGDHVGTPINKGCAAMLLIEEAIHAIENPEV